MRLFEKKTGEGLVEQRFDAMLNMIKDLPRADYNRLKSAMDLAYDAYQKVRNVKTIDEKETAEVDSAEKKLETLEIK